MVVAASIALTTVALALTSIIKDLGGDSHHDLALETNPQGIRGVMLAKGESIMAHSVVMEIPFDACLRDDDDKSPIATSDDWFVRLAASLLALQPTPAQEAWLSLLPNPDELRASLPIHWEEDELEDFVASNKLEIDFETAVDVAYFGRYDAMSQLMAAEKQWSDRECQNALDLVQTRSCRIDETRMMVPIIDLLNHSFESNAEFVGQDNSVVVKALVDIAPGQEVLIDYGEASTRPEVWKTLVSYGFR